MPQSVSYLFIVIPEGDVGVFLISKSEQGIDNMHFKNLKTEYYIFMVEILGQMQKNRR